MPHLWIRHEDEWAVAPLSGGVFTFVTDSPYVQRRAPQPGETALVRIPHAGDVADGAARWVMVGLAHAARINGTVVAGLKVLDDRDELRPPGVERCFFSTERLAAIAAAPSLDRLLFCPRCKLAIDPGSPAVECPVCGVWHHQGDERPCWSYAPECAVCRHDTNLDRGFSWSPEGL